MSVLFTNSLGDIVINNNVVGEIAGTVAGKCYGVVGMAARNKKDGIVNLLKHDNINRGIDISVEEDNKVTVEMHIVVEYGINIKAACKSIANRVRYTLEDAVGIQVKSVNIRVEGIRVSE